MSLHLITGYAGSEHITSADQGAYNIATFGDGQFVFSRGEEFGATILSNNSINIKDGEAMMKGRYIKMPKGTTETVTIDNGTQETYRNDLIVIRYTKSSTDNTESAALTVIKGTESSGTAVDPSYTDGDITDGTDTVNDMPLYRVSLNGISIDSITALFTIKKSMIDYTPPTASTSTLGVMKVGSGLSVSNGVVSNNYSYSLPTASASTLGGVKVGSGLAISSGVLSTKRTVKSYEVFSSSKVTIASKDFEYITPSVIYSGDIVIFEPSPHFVPVYGLENGKMVLNSASYVNDWSSSVTVSKGDTIGYVYVINFA